MFLLYCIDMYVQEGRESLFLKKLKQTKEIDCLSLEFPSVLAKGVNIVCVEAYFWGEGEGVRYM